jgi:hypothetical protein
MNKVNFYFLFLALTLGFSCKKDKDTCQYDSCDSRRRTVMTATNWSGRLGYFNDLRKWAVNVSIPNTTDGLRTCIICSDIPDSLKVIGKMVTFSGDLKESCGNPSPQLGGQEMYFVNPSQIK